MQNKTLLVDGHSLAFRAFHGIKPDTFVLKNGQHTNAVYGFINSLIGMYNDYQPTHVAIAFDYSRKSFRTEIYPEYKDGRKETPVEFHGQIEIIQKILDALNIKWYCVENYEADDIIATLTKRSKDAGNKVIVYSGDRDVIQLVDKDVSWVRPMRAGALKDYGIDEVVEDFGVVPQLYSDVAALVGETADNIIGVPGIGKKTAVTLINKYGNLEAVLENADNIKGKKGESLRQYAEQARFNRRLNQLLLDMPLDANIADLQVKVADKDQVERAFDEINSNRLKQSAINVFCNIQEDHSEKLEVKNITCFSADALRSWISECVKDCCVVYADGQYIQGVPHVHSLLLATDESTVKIDVDKLSNKSKAELESLFQNQSITKVFHDFKKQIHLLRHLGFYSNYSYEPWNLDTFGQTSCMDLAKQCQDIMLIEYIMEPDKGKYSIEDLASFYLKTNLKLPKFKKDDPEKQIVEQELLCAKAVAIYLIYKMQIQIFSQQDTQKIYRNIEIPSSVVLGRMEENGISVDMQTLTDIEKEFANRVEFAKREAFSAIGHEINLSSTKQLQAVLFDELKMPHTKKTKTGYTTNAEALTDLYIQTGHEFLGALLAHRNAIKMQQIVNSLLAEVNKDSKIHTTFLQTGAATGRLSSVAPNLQNIPARDEDGSRIRESFVKSDGSEGIMTADYSQIEMRIMAHMCQDQTLIDAFCNGEDLHNVVASIVYGVDKDKVTKTQRTHIKAMSYGLLYGLSSYGLSRQLGISVQEAKKLMDTYFAKFGKIKDFLDNQVAEAEKNGYTTTLFGRKRLLPDLNSTNYNIRENARRAALNAPIQGTAADIVKQAMLDVQKAMDENGMNSKIVLQVHDELIFDIYRGETEKMSQIVRECMENVTKLSVPLEVGIGFGANWREAAH